MPGCSSIFSTNIAYFSSLHASVLADYCLCFLCRNCFQTVQVVFALVKKIICLSLSNGRTRRI
jgi:hypothetical protein